MEENVGPASSEQSSPPPPSEWFGIWLQAVTRPNERTYVEIARRADIKTAYLWLVLAFLIPNMVNVLFSGVFILAIGLLGGFDDTGLDTGVIALMIGLLGVGFLVYTFFQIATFSLIAILSNAIAKAFGGVGDFRQLIYCFAAVAFPISMAVLVLSILSCIPGLGYLFSMIGLALIVYPLVLNVIATKAVHQIETWQAAIPSVSIVALIAGVMCCFMIAWAALAIPVFGQILPVMFEHPDLLPFPPGF